MKHRAVDLVLLLVALLGGILAFQTGRQQSRLRGEHERLSRITGDLPILFELQLGPKGSKP
jgi:hypothetical protein